MLPDVIQSGSISYMNTADAFYQNVFTTSERVVPAAGAIGRSWQVIQPIDVGVAGAFKYRNINHSDELQPNTGIPWVAKSVRTYQTLDELSMIGYENLTMQLIEGVGNFALPHYLLRADLLSAVVVDLIAKNINGVVRNKGSAELQSFYTTDDTNKTLATINGSVTLGGGSPVANSIATFSIDDGRIYMFTEGMFLSAYDSTGTVQRHAGVKLLVIRVDPVAETLTVADPTGQTALSALADNDILVRADSLGIGLQGLNTWTKNTGTVLGLSLSSNPRLKSLVKGMSSAILTETVLNETFGKYYDAFGPLLSKAVTTTGVINKHYADLVTFDGATSTSDLGTYQIQRQGQAVDRVTGYKMSGGVGIRHVCGGKSIDIYASQYQDKGVFHSVITDNANIKRYVPPRVGGMGSNSQFGSEVEFIYGYDNGGSIFAPITTTVPGATGIAVSDHVQAPFSAVMNRMAQRVNGIKLTGLAELDAIDFTS